MKWIVEYFYCYNSNEMYCVFMNMLMILTRLNNTYATKPYGYDFYGPYEFPIRMIKYETNFIWVAGNENQDSPALS